MTKPVLADLVALYFQQDDDFNSNAKNIPEEEWEAALDSTAWKTMRKIIGVPANSRDDALAALDWLIKQRAIEMEGNTPFERTAASLVRALRGYLERG